MSYDWTLDTDSLPVSATWYNAAYGNDIFLVTTVSGANRSCVSGDGDTWSIGGLLSSMYTSNVLAFGNGVFVVTKVNSNPGVHTSPDGVVWTPRTTPSTYALGPVVYDPLWGFVVTAQSSIKALYSSDGITWNVSNNLPATRSWVGLCAGGGTFLTWEYGTTAAATSTNGGLTWTSQTLGASNPYAIAAYGAGLFVMPIGGTAYLTSPDGVTWTSRTLPVSKNPSALVFANDTFFLCDNTTSILTSTDGLTWVEEILPIAIRNFAGNGMSDGTSKVIAFGGTGATNDTVIRTPTAINFWENSVGVGQYVG